MASFYSLVCNTSLVHSDCFSSSRACGGSSFVECVDWSRWGDSAVIVSFICRLCRPLSPLIRINGFRKTFTFPPVWLHLLDCTVTRVSPRAPIRRTDFNSSLNSNNTSLFLFLLTALSLRFIRHISVCCASLHLSIPPPPLCWKGQQRTTLPPSARCY